MREEKGGVYGIGVYPSLTHYPKEGYEITIEFGCAPERAEDLINTALQDIENVKKNGAEEKNIVKIKETMRREREVDLKENSFWLGVLSSTCMNNENVLELLDYNKFIENIKSDDLKNLANQYFNMQNYAKFVLMPEK